MVPATADAERLVVAVFAPSGRDGELAHGVLAQADIASCRVPTMAELCNVISRGVGAVVLAEETLRGRDGELLLTTLSQQPAWSDLPMIIVASRTVTESPRRSDALVHLGNVTIIERPTRIRQLINAVQAALRTRRRQYDAERAIAQRDTFLAMLGHELRNPLAAIVLSSDFLNERVARESTEYKHHATIQRQARHLQRLVDDLLDVSRVTTGKAVLQRAVLDIGPLLKRTVSRVARDDTRVTLRLPSIPIWVNGDEVRLEQIVANLVTNALKYTPPPGPIAITLGVATGECVITVRDEGIGIAPDMLHRIFDLFAQADSAMARSEGGMGVGLTLVRDLVDRHGGHVEARSDGLGRGSTFIVRLPITAAPATAVTDATRTSAPAQRRVVVVEDNEDLRDIVCAILERAGHHTSVASSGDAGLALILAEKPDIALVDLGLPGLDGHEVARRVRARLGSSIALVAVSGYGLPEDKRAAHEAGFDRHLTKPIDTRTLLGMLELVRPSAIAS